MIGKFLYRHQEWVKKRYLRVNASQLRVNEFCVISNNCWGGIVYNDLQLPYQSPFVNMFMHGDCYIRMLENLDYYLSLQIRFTDRSKYFSGKTTYPVGLLGDVEIHFIHYKTDEEASVRWESRLARMNTDRVIFVLSERDGCTSTHVARFDALPYAHKVIFSTRNYELATTKVVHSRLWARTVPAADQMAGVSYKKLDLVGYLNALQYELKKAT